MKSSNCCGANVCPDSDICMECKEHCEVEDEICKTCGGEGEIVDKYNVREWTIDLPFTKCPECHGTGKREE